MLQIAQLFHVAPVDQAGEIVSRGELVNARQRVLQLGLLLLQACAHRRQITRQYRDGGQHDGGEDEVDAFEGRVENLRRMRGHGQHHEPEDSDRKQAKQLRGPRAEREGRKHQHQRDDHQQHAA